MNTGTPPSSPNENPATIRDSWLYQRFCSVTGISFFPWFLILYLATAASGPHPTPGSLVFAEVILVFPLLALVCGLSGKLCNWLGWTRSAIISLGIAAYAGMSFCVFPIVAIPIGLSLEQSTSLQNIVALTVFLTLCLSALAIYAICRYSQSLSARSKVPSEALSPQHRPEPLFCCQSSSSAFQNRDRHPCCCRIC